MVFGWGKKGKKAGSKAADGDNSKNGAAADSVEPPDEPFRKCELPTKADISKTYTSKYFFSKAELLKLKDRFKHNCDDETGKMDRNAFLSQVEFSCCPAVIKLCVDNLLVKKTKEGAGDDNGKDGNGSRQQEEGEKKEPTEKEILEAKAAQQLSFDDFLAIMSLFSHKSSPEVKYDFLFESIDVNERGTLNFEDFFVYYRMAIGANTSDDVIALMCKEVMNSCGALDESKRLVLTKEAFKNFANQVELEQKMTVFF